MRYPFILPVAIGLSGCAAPRERQAAVAPAGSVGDECPQPEVPGRLSGADEARRDIAAGLLVIKGYGLEPAPQPLVDMLRERLGVVLVDAAGCSAIGIVEVEAYNCVMRDEIARRFGAEALKNVYAEAARVPLVDVEP